MELPANTFKRALKAGKVQIGLWCSLSHTTRPSRRLGIRLICSIPSLAERPESVPQQCRPPALPHASVVRVPWNDMVTIKRFLDIGAQSILIHVQNADEAKTPSPTRYRPRALRGVAGGTRATRFARVKDYAKRAHEELCVLVQIETQQGLDNLEKIAAVEGVDGVFIGPADLHASLGYTGETNNPKIMPVIDDAIRRIRKCGKAPGILTGVEADARRWLDCGGLFVAVGADTGVLARGTEALAAKFR
jgi:4-hydroxy-2-oxoheptanedioate aldolase